MALLGLDIGTTHCKAGLFAEDGTTLRVAARAMPRVTIAGAPTYPPAEVWDTALSVIAAVIAATPTASVTAIGIASMAETGLLLDRQSGTPRTSFIPWFDTTATPAATTLLEAAPAGEHLARSGIRPSAKCGLAKLLHLREADPALLAGAVWLSVADYVAYRLTGALATDESLAGRTCAFALLERSWDAAWLDRFALPATLFPSVVPSGTPVGVTDGQAQASGLAMGIPVALGGHDHVCAMIGAGIGAPGQALDSMGTAEVLAGPLTPQPLGDAALRSGLTFGIMPLTGSYYWMGGLSSAGGALDWLRGILGEPPLSYAALVALQGALPPEPGDLLFLPYLAGSGAPLPNPLARGAFIGLTASHDRAALLKAVLEGTAFQLEAVRRAAAALNGNAVETIVVAGGGTRNSRWLQIKADIYGVPLDVGAADEATLLGAALIAGVGCRLYPDAATALAVAAARPRERVLPDTNRQYRYAAKFTEEFVPWQGRLVTEA